MIPGDLLSAFPHRQFHRLPGLLDSWVALPNSNPNACMLMQGGSLHHFYDGLWYDPVERRTHDLPCERRTRYRLSQPDTVQLSHSTNTLIRYDTMFAKWHFHKNRKVGLRWKIGLCVLEQVKKKMNVHCYVLSDLYLTKIQVVCAGYNRIVPLSLIRWRVLLYKACRPHTTRFWAYDDLQCPPRRRCRNSSVRPYAMPSVKILYIGIVGHHNFLKRFKKFREIVSYPG